MLFALSYLRKKGEGEGAIPRWSDRLWSTPALAPQASAPGRSRLRAAIAARLRYSICASAKRIPAAALRPHHSFRSGAASRTLLRADRPTPAHPLAAKRLLIPAWDFGSARYRRSHPGSLGSRPRRPANPRAAIQFEKHEANFLRAMESAIAAAQAQHHMRLLRNFINNPAGGVCRTTVLMACSLYTRSATRRISPRERNSLLASETFFPTRFGMDTSRPWMAMRIAVIALKIRRRSQNKYQQQHPEHPFKAFAKVHNRCFSSFISAIASFTAVIPSEARKLSCIVVASPTSLCQRRRRIIRQLILAGIRTLHLQFIEEQGRRNHRGRNSAGAITDQRNRCRQRSNRCAARVRRAR